LPQARLPEEASFDPCFAVLTDLVINEFTLVTAMQIVRENVISPLME
jgi:hypothetical protein